MRSKIKFVILGLIFVTWLALWGGSLSDRPRLASAVGAAPESTPTPAWIEPEPDLAAMTPAGPLHPALPVVPPRAPGATGCSPNSDQVGLFSDANFQGECVLKASGDYTNTVAIGLPYDTIGSIQVGNYVTATLCQEEKFNGICEAFSSDDPNLSDNINLSNRTRSLKVEGCLPGPGQAALFSSVNYSGRCLILDTGIYTSSMSLDPVGDNDAESLRVAPGAQAILCDQESFGGECEAFLADTPNLGSSTVGANSVSSAKIQGLPDLRPMPVIASPVLSTTVTGTLFAGSPTYFDWHYTNSGAGTAFNGFTVELWVNNTRYVNYPFEKVDAGKVRGFNDWAETILNPGWQTVRLVVDPGNTVVESDETNNVWQGQVFWSVPDSWRSELFNNETLAGAPVLVRYDPEINFAWDYSSPGRGVKPDGFSVRWTRTIAFTPGGYEFTLVHDDGARIWVDGRLALDAWGSCCQIDNLRLSLDGGEHLLVVEMFDHYGVATARLTWQKLFGGYRSYMPVMRRR